MRIGSSSHRQAPRRHDGGPTRDGAGGEPVGRRSACEYGRSATARWHVTALPILLAVVGEDTNATIQEKLADWLEQGGGERAIEKRHA